MTKCIENQFEVIRQTRHPLLLAGIFLFVVQSFFNINVVHAAPSFPKLSGRVVDSASMLDQASAQRIGQLLQGHETATGNQIVVVTIKNLGGDAIESYGYQLGRHWGIGQKGKDNGVLLIVAKKERKVRIEVGYGLEGMLTDALSSNIIHSVILPQFKKGQFGQGIESGATAIVQALGGQYKIRSVKNKNDSTYGFFKFIFILFFIFISFMRNMVGGYGYRRGVGYYGSSRSSGGGFGGGFSGGGGGFGGGGASGGW